METDTESVDYAVMRKMNDGIPRNVREICQQTKRSRGLIVAAIARLEAERSLIYVGKGKYRKL